LLGAHIFRADKIGSLSRQLAHSTSLLLRGHPKPNLGGSKPTSSSRTNPATGQYLEKKEPGIYIDHAGSNQSFCSDLKVGTEEVVEHIRSLLARYPDHEGTVRRLVATDARFDALCHEYNDVIALLERFEAEAARLRQRRVWLEEEFLTRIEGYQPS
jgi:hypothetical protein